MERFSGTMCFGRFGWEIRPPFSMPTASMLAFVSAIS